MLEQVQQDISSAMKAGDKKTAGALRVLYSALKNAQIDNRGSLSNEEAASIIKKEIKKRVEARDLYASNNRQEQAAQEEFERILLAKYVPAQLTEAQIDEITKDQADRITDVNFAKLMPLVMKETKGNADGRLVSDRVKAYLNGTIEA